MDEPRALRQGKHDDDGHRPLRLSHRLDAADVRKRLGRFGADRFEPARLTLWAMAIGKAPRSPSAWLIGSSDLSRALLLPSARLCDEPSARRTDPLGSQEALPLEGGGQPSAAQFERWWLWERLAKPRRWVLRVQPETLCRVELPLWLGYRDGRRTRLIVLSGLSGEALGMLKPAVLAGFGRLQQ